MTMLAATIALGVLLAPASAWAQATVFPSKPVTMIVPFAPGSATETEARLYGKRMQDSLKQPFLVDFKAGAAGQIGYNHVAKAPADGHTLLIVTGGFVVGAAVQKNLTYDPINAFAPISLLSTRPAILVTHPGLAKNFQEYIAYGRANPGKINLGDTGAGGLSHISGAWLHSTINVKVTHVHYKGNSAVYLDLIAGRIQAGVVSLAGGMPYEQAGKLRIMGVASAQRARLAPDRPTLWEQGAVGYDYFSWYGVSAPGATPAVVVNKLSEEFNKAVHHPESVTWLNNGGAEPVGSTPEAFRKLVATDIARWAKAAKDAGIDSVEE